MIIGLKSSKELQGEWDIRSITIPERKIVSCLHRGTYSELAVLYNEMMEWIKPTVTNLREHPLNIITAILTYPKKNR